jgi:hypothetical protein
MIWTTARRRILQVVEEELAEHLDARQQPVFVNPLLLGPRLKPQYAPAQTPRRPFSISKLIRSYIAKTTLGR